MRKKLQKNWKKVLIAWLTVITLLLTIGKQIVEVLGWFLAFLLTRAVIIGGS